jgi:hypothetical protein
MGLDDDFLGGGGEGADSGGDDGPTWGVQTGPNQWQVGNDINSDGMPYDLVTPDGPTVQQSLNQLSVEGALNSVEPSAAAHLTALHPHPRRRRGPLPRQLLHRLHLAHQHHRRLRRKNQLLFQLRYRRLHLHRQSLYRCINTIRRWRMRLSRASQTIA